MAKVFPLKPLQTRKRGFLAAALRHSFIKSFRSHLDCNLHPPEKNKHPKEGEDVRESYELVDHQLSTVAGQQAFWIWHCKVRARLSHALAGIHCDLTKRQAQHNPPISPQSWHTMAHRFHDLTTQGADLTTSQRQTASRD